MALLHIFGGMETAHVIFEAHAVFAGEGDTRVSFGGDGRCEGGGLDCGLGGVVTGGGEFDFSFVLSTEELFSSNYHLVVEAVHGTRNVRIVLFLLSGCFHADSLCLVSASGRSSHLDGILHVVTFLHQILVFDLWIRILHHGILDRVIVLFFFGGWEPIFCKVDVPVDHSGLSITDTSPINRRVQFAFFLYQ